MNKQTAMKKIPKEVQSKVLYEKIGRRYHPVRLCWQHSDLDSIELGKAILIVAVSEGLTSYCHDVEPADAEWAAAARKGKEALIQALMDSATARPPQNLKLTKKQNEILERFKKEMKEAGGLLPLQWQAPSIYEIADKAIDAVEKPKEWRSRF